MNYRFIGFLATAAILFFAGVGSGSTRPDVFGCGNAGGGWTLLDPVGYDQEMYRRMGQANVASCRIGASWADIEQIPGVYDWSETDKQVDLCAENGIEPYCLIVNAPSWADGNPDATWDTPILESAAPYFTAFCTALAERYRGRVKYYEFWNEENGYGWHHENDQFNWYWEYLPWLKRAYQGLKAGDPDCMVAVGGLDDADGHAPMYLWGLYNIGAKGYFDAVATHPYDKGRGADDLRNRLRALHNVMAANGDGDKPLWITEWGYNYTDEHLQASKINWYLDIILEPEFSYVTMASYLAFSDMENNIGGWGLTDQCLRDKLAFQEFQDYPRDGQVTIHHVEFDEIGLGRLRVRWQTTPAADGQVFYGLTRDYGSSSPPNPSLTTSHQETIDGLTPGCEYHFKVASGGCESGDYRVYVPGMSLYNPGFEGEWRGGQPAGWRVQGKSRRLDSSTVGWINQKHSGDHALLICLATSWGYTLHDTAYQKVAVGMNRGYEFSAWLWNHPDNASPLARVGTDPTGGTNPDSPSVIWSSSFTSKDWWGQRSVCAVSESEIVTVFIETNTLVNDGAMHYFCTDDASLVSYTPLGEVKDLPDGTWVNVMGVVSASSDQFLNHCYIQLAGTPNGLRVDRAGDFCNLGDVAIVSGTLTTVNGERRLSASSFTAAGSSLVGAVGLTNAAFFLGEAPDHSGALVRVWGEVKSVDAAGKHFVIDDGTAADGVKVVYTELASGNTIVPPPVGAFVGVNGISSIEDQGGSPARVLKVRGQSDINMLD